MPLSGSRYVFLTNWLVDESGDALDAADVRADASEDGGEAVQAAGGGITEPDLQQTDSGVFYRGQKSVKGCFSPIRCK